MFLNVLNRILTYLGNVLTVQRNIIISSLRYRPTCKTCLYKALNCWYIETLLVAVHPIKFTLGLSSKSGPRQSNCRNTQLIRNNCRNTINS